ncbi:hypothetical protein HPB51_020564 [Rhipicephalus microplus]|uniref:Uncharacterized protein n=1 Tax=Rhipicephalus microplus TaxID=6941 RepID=A0A9J6DWP4_RHIMP|nr:hypothetical protein HPB51_020564 [Rhipicephalus microplus]
MDEHSRHGIVVFDEMKLSEHNDVEPSGAIEGFFDLGQFETEGSGKELADHGLVVVFQPFTAKPPKTGNCSPEVINSLVGHCNASLSQDKQNPINALDCLVDDGKLDDVEAVLDFLPPEDHSRRMYWSRLLRQSHIADCMPRNCFEEVISLFHACNNDTEKKKEEDGYDKLYKVRPLLSRPNYNFQGAAEMEDCLAVDEMIVPFKGRHSLTVYMNKKPRVGLQSVDTGWEIRLCVQN